MFGRLVSTFKNRLAFMAIVIVLFVPAITQAFSMSWEAMWGCTTANFFIFHLTNAIGGWIIWV